ncbi:MULTISPECIES: DUF6415 family natural product biosynthesis protein [unclassified Streptomyces]|uniref:DUF6415 family natural product biosynthesis protein n=1 Tax=unclassified Streptomyces TaxID=2593676 RepID=UPI00093955BF|nr:DUF6415 family natural product biosynthesis protein [Streptomyces sp. TSRI0281]OKI45325.1 hypothetical protein A6A29_32360 [Streptomyces sp. TSRI0281]
MIAATIDRVLAWDLAGADLPPADVALGLLSQLTHHGQTVATDLSTLCLSLPPDSQAGHTAKATLGEASRRLSLSAPAGTPQAAAHRTQNTARLLRALLRAVEAVAEEAQIPRR